MIRIIQNLEFIVIEIVLWIILLPKTFFKVLFRPIEITRYFENEWEKEEMDRFNEHQSPVTFWLLLGPIFFAIIARIDSGTLAGLEFIVKIYMILFLAGPLGFALTMQRFTGDPINKKTLAKYFSLQCYFFGVFSLINNCFFLTGTIAVSMGYEDHPTVGIFMGIILLGSFIWLSSTELKTIRQIGINYSPYKFLVIGWMIVIGFLSFFIFFLIMIIKLLK